MICNVSFTLNHRRQLGQFVRVVKRPGPGGTKGPTPTHAIVRTADGREHTVLRNSIETYHDPRAKREYSGQLHRTREVEKQSAETRRKKN